MVFIIAGLCDVAGQDLMVDAYRSFPDPIVPYLSYSQINQKNLPTAIEEAVYVWEKDKATWQKVAENDFTFNQAGFVTLFTAKQYSFNNLSKHVKTIIQHENGVPSSVHIADYKYTGTINTNIEFLLDENGLVGYIKNNDTLAFNGSTDGNRKEMMHYVHNGKTIKWEHTNRILGLTGMKTTAVSYGDDMAPVFDYTSNGNKIGRVNIYMPDNPSFFMKSFDVYPNIHPNQLTEEIEFNLEAYKNLIDYHLYDLSEKQKEGFKNHITFYTHQNGDWIAHYNRRHWFYDKPRLIMRKITYPDGSTAGKLEADDSFMKDN